MRQGLAPIAVLLVVVAGIAIYTLSGSFAPRSPAIDIHTLIAQKKIAVTAWGKCPDGITMKIVSQADEDLPLIIPAGTLFVSPPPRLDPKVATPSAPPAYADLVTIAPMEFVLTPQHSEGFNAAAVCAHTFGRYVEFRNDYEPRMVEPKSDLARVIQVLASGPYDQVPRGGAGQAAIWIAADDVGYSAIGALVVRYYPNGVILPDISDGRNVSRAIQAPQVLLALDILDRAGIDLRRRKIWADRNEILRLATNPSLENAPRAASPDKGDAEPSSEPGESGEADPAPGTSVEQPSPALDPPNPEPPKPAPDVRTFRNCPECPEMMATSRFFEAIGRREVTFAQWDACVAAGGCNGYTPPDDGNGRGDRPVTHVSYEDAAAYARWLSERTGKPYELVDSTVWYLALHGDTPASMNDPDLICDEAARIGARFSICADRPRAAAAPRLNPFGLSDMPGNVWEWVKNCAEADCSTRMLLGGSGYLNDQGLPPSYRSGAKVGIRDIGIGFRVAMVLPIRTR
jgi:Sulfatase-modifying factor enzyme 1